MEIYERIKKRRKEIGLSADDVAKALNVSRATIYRYESQEIEKLPTKIIEPLAKVLKCSIPYLMGWDEPDIMIKDQNVNPQLDVLVEIAKNISSSQFDRLLSYAQYLKTEKDKD